MNNKKFCFIICTNNELILSECIHYLNHLIIPEDYEIDLITIEDAESITSGYITAQQASDAKYKIYMHQDVFILNKNILHNLLEIFESDSQIGMVGMIGYENISPDGIMWHGKKRGDIYSHNPIFSYPSLSKYRYSLTNDGYSYVAEIDGLFMATAYDIPWNTTSLTGWDFYDAFQSINYLLHGYKLVVPKQLHPWCLHDDGVVLNLLHYNQYRKLFMQEYNAFLGKSAFDFPAFQNKF